MKLILCFLVLFCSGCLSSQKYSERSAFLLNELAEEVSHEFPNNQRIQGIAKKTGAHAEDSAGFDLSWIVQLVALCGGPQNLALGGLAMLGMASPGIKLGKKKKEVTA